MTELDLYQVDAFVNWNFEGNPAGVISFDKLLSDELIQSFAQKNNLLETAFFCKSSKEFSIKWFRINR